MYKRLSLILVLFVLTLAIVPVARAAAAGDDFQWKQWRSLPVLEGGRVKPFDTLAWETWRIIGNRTSFKVEESKREFDSVGLFLAVMLDWKGWDGKLAAPDDWDNSALILVESLELRKALGMKDDQKYISAVELVNAEVVDPRTKAKSPFLTWAQKISDRPEKTQTEYEKKAFQTAVRLHYYDAVRTGRAMLVVPSAEKGKSEWLSVADLMQQPLDDTSDPEGRLRALQTKFKAVRKAWLSGSAGAFNEASADFISQAKETGSKLGEYAAIDKIGLEIAYNHYAPFRFAWILTALACICALLAMATPWRAFYASAMLAYVAGMAAMFTGFFMRVSISGRAPVTNMYESMIYVGLGVTGIGLILELIYRKRFVLLAAAAVATFILVLADNCPALMDPSLKPLQPVLRNNFWLVIHVMTITMSYAAFALACGISNITLGYHLGSGNYRSEINELSRFNYRALQVGVVLLAAGTILGGVWAAYSWGRFWGWDPKEVWALIALLGYLAVLHARYVGWVGNRGSAVLSILCFSLVVTAWYGVNFVMGSGLHSYGSGAGGLPYVMGAIAVQLAYIGYALTMGRGDVSDGAEVLGGDSPEPKLVPNAVSSSAV